MNFVLAKCVRLVEEMRLLLFYCSPSHQHLRFFWLFTFFKNFFTALPHTSTFASVGFLLFTLFLNFLYCSPSHQAAPLLLENANNPSLKKMR